MGRYNNSGLFHGTNGSPQTSISQSNYGNGVESNSNLESSTINSNISVNKQNKHIKGSKEFVDGKSEITISVEKCQQLVNDFIGKGQKINSNKERVDFGEIIGNYVDENGNRQPTTIGIIHKSKTGCHIVPAKPKGGSK